LADSAGASQARLHTLDGLRGAAVLGILLMNVNAFAMPPEAYGNPANYGPRHWPDTLLWWVEFVAFDGKLRAIFSALFGASLLLVAERAEAAGRAAGRVGLVRLGTLAGFGLLHGILLWAGDILLLYAVVGMLALPLRRLPVDRLLVLAGLLAVLQFAVAAANYHELDVLRLAAQRPQAAAADVAAWRDALGWLGPPAPGALARDLALHRGPWTALAAARAAELPGLFAAELLFDGPETLGLMLLGMAGLRSGFLGGAWRRDAYDRTARWLYLAALPPLAAAGGWLVVRGFPPLATAAAIDLALPLRWMVAAAHSALIVGWLTGPLTPVKRRLIAAGRMAFSNYLGTSLVMAALFDGWGLGLYGRIERWLLLPFVFAAWALMLAWSRPWLARHAHGPLEWLWRSLAAGRPARWRRSAIANGLHCD